MRRHFENSPYLREYGDITLFATSCIDCEARSALSLLFYNKNDGYCFMPWTLQCAGNAVQVMVCSTSTDTFYACASWRTALAVRMNCLAARMNSLVAIYHVRGPFIGYGMKLYESIAFIGSVQKVGLGPPAPRSRLDGVSNFSVQKGRICTPSTSQLGDTSR